MSAANVPTSDPSARPLRVLAITRADAPADERAWIEALTGASDRFDATRAEWRGLAQLWKRSRTAGPDLVVLPAQAWAVPAFALLSAIGRRSLAVDMGGDSRAPLAARIADGSVRRREFARPADFSDQLAGAAAAVAARPGAGRSDGPCVSVVSTVLNEVAAIDKLVEQVLAQLRTGDEFVVADGGSDDGTAERLREWCSRDGRIKLVDARGSNIAAGRNVAIAAAAHSLIACTDAGCEPAPGWLAALRRPFAEPDPPGMVAGTPSIIADTPFERAQALACYPDPADSRKPSLFVRAYGRLLGQVMDPTLPFARSLSFTTEAWRSADGFPERLDWVEDGAFGREVAKRNRVLLTLDADVSWTQRASLKATIKMYYRYGLGSAESANAKLRARDGARAVAYAVGIALPLVAGRRGLTLTFAGAGIYYSLPLRRIARHRAGWRAAACVPVAMAAKDLAKVAGAAHYYWQARVR